MRAKGCGAENGRWTIAPQRHGDRSDAAILCSSALTQLSPCGIVFIGNGFLEMLLRTFISTESHFSFPQTAKHQGHDISATSKTYNTCP
jgi:hypothetical protein